MEEGRERERPWDVEALLRPRTQAVRGGEEVENGNLCDGMVGELRESGDPPRQCGVEVMVYDCHSQVGKSSTMKRWPRGDGKW